MMDPTLLRGAARLQIQIAALRRLDFRQVRPGPMPELAALSEAIAGTLGDCFGADPASGRRFQAAAALVPPPGGPDAAGSRLRQAVRGNVQRAIALLEDAQRVLRARAAGVTPASSASPSLSAETSRRVLVVHGKDGGAHRHVARFLDGLGLEAVCVARQARAGTVLVRLEDGSGAGFAVLLLTPDDTGRPHVLLELGYLIGYWVGRLGRARVCVLMRGGFDLPADVQAALAGVVWQVMDRRNGWQPVLGQALRAAGYGSDGAPGQEAGRRS